MLEYVADRAVAPCAFPVGYRRLPAAGTCRQRRPRALAADVLHACRGGSRPRRSSGACPHRRHRPRDRPRPDRRGDSRRAHRLHERRTRHHRHDLGVLAVAARRHPECRSGCGRRSPPSATASSRPTTSRNLGYTVQVLHEALRLCPPAAAIGPAGHAGHRGRRLPGQEGTMVAVGDLCDSNGIPRCGSEPTDSTPTGSARVRQVDRPLAVPAVRRRAADLRRRPLRHARTRAGPGTVVRRNEIRSLETDFPMATPFTMVAAAPIRARVIPVPATPPRTPRAASSAR